jgi:catechol 2,3-dioxygenase-like lactoylglutathione lyase family enzyme
VSGAPAFSGGGNIALKAPAHLYDDTVRFYAETLGLPVVDRQADSVAFAFGAVRLWVDRAPAMTQPELRLELTVDDPWAAAAHLAERGVVRCDSVESLPAGFAGFWIAGPGGIVHLVSKPGE